MPTSPLNGSTDLVTLTVLVDGKAIPNVYQIVRVCVQREFNRIPSAQITLLDGSAADETFELSESADFVPGNEIEIKAGYHSQDTTVFKGVVVKHSIRIRSDASLLEVTCYDRALRLTVARHSALFVKQKDSDVLTKLLQAAGLTASVEATTEVHEELTQHYATDWDFIVSRAEVNGKLVVIDDGNVIVKAPAVSASPELVVTYGESLQQLDAEIDARSQIASVKCSAWDFTTQQVAEGASSEPTVNAHGNLSGRKLADVLGVNDYCLQTPVPLKAEALKRWANARLLKSRLARVRGTVSFQGNAAVKPGQLIELAGLGARFNGNALIAGVTHTIEKGEWVTKLGFGLSPRWFAEEQDNIEAPPASGLLPGVQGLHIATVKQIDQDPDGQTRICVSAPMLTHGTDGIWARLASGYATNNAGIFILPEIADEVVLGFLNDDPRFPVVLGSLYSSKHAPPFTPDNKNTNMAIITKGQVKIRIDDDKKVVVIETPGGQVVTLSDQDKSITLQDSSNNRVTLSSSGIALDSAADIWLKAGGNVKIEATAGVDVKAGASLDLQGLDISAKAQTGLSAQGEARSQLTSSGEVTVQGAIVMIN
jgi:Rhs element Vgr protein